jgi:hypothetical protein
MAKLKEEAANVEKGIYKVLGGLFRHNGKLYRTNSKVALTAAEAAPHIKNKTVQPVAAEPAK